MDERELTALLRLHASRHSVPGAVLGTFRDGTVTIACCGVADVRTGAPVTHATLFSAGSLTKSMVATVMARLADEGRLSLEDPVSAHVPELRERDWAQRSTLRDLLANRSGLPLSVGLEFDFAGRKDEDDGALSRLVADVAGGPPAGFWSYTNVGWCVLGRVIETATGVPWEKAMRRHLKGTGMTDTLFAADALDGRRASGNEVTADGPVPVEPLAARAYGPAGTSRFTSSTSFANPAVTVARTLSDTFAGIAPSSVPMFVLMQLVGGALGLLLARVLYADLSPVASRTEAAAA